MRLKLLLPLLLLAASMAQAAEPRTSPVAVGETAPDFNLQDQNGQTAKLSAASGQRPVVIVFYRGSW
jgi:hypothetical protein